VNVEKALYLFLKGAARGSTLAMVDAGSVYWEIGKNNEGVRMYKRVAELGYPAGQFNAYMNNDIKTVSRSCCYMAERKVGSDVGEDLTRESLIALSYSLPDFDLPLTEFPKNMKSITKAVNTNEKEKVRCNLISISYAESLDSKNSPVLVVKYKSKWIENGAKTGNYGFVAIKSAYYSKSRQSREKSLSMPLEKA
ncbi:F-box family protein, partial [Tanacetum coccineum]